MVGLTGWKKNEQIMVSFIENVLYQFKKKKPKADIGNWIKWLPTGVVGKVVGFIYSSGQKKMVFRMKNGSEVEVYDNPQEYKIIMR